MTTKRKNIKRNTKTIRKSKSVSKKRIAVKPIQRTKKKKSYIVKDKLIESFEEGCLVTGRNPKHRPIVKHLLPQDRQRSISAYELDVIYEAQNLNDGFVPDFLNWSQEKWTAGSTVKKGGNHPSGFVFSLSVYGYWHTVTYVGARLCVKTRERALELERKFESQHLDVRFPVKIKPKRNTKTKINSPKNKK